MKHLTLALLLIAPVAYAEVVPGVSGCMYRSEVQNIQGRQVIASEASTCVEEPPVEIRKVKIGDYVRIGQVQSHPTQRSPFMYRGAVCWWFSEPGAKGRDMIMYQGIMCEVKPNVWQVVDKF